MKIFDKNKDYYDYLSGIYGIDETIFFDRRGSEFIKHSKLKDMFSTHFSSECVRSKYPTKPYITYWRVTLEVGFMHYHLRSTFYKEKSNNTWKYTFQNVELIKKERCKHVSKSVISFLEDKFDNPILIGTPIVDIIPAEEIYQEIYQYLAYLKEPDTTDKRTNVQKIESKGFDKKTSFRNPIKL